MIRLPLRKARTSWKRTLYRLAEGEAALNSVKTVAGKSPWKEGDHLVTRHPRGGLTSNDTVDLGLGEDELGNSP